MINTTTQFVAYNEGERPLKNAAKPKLTAFVSISFLLCFLCPHLIFRSQDPSSFTCTAGTENNAWCKTNGFDIAVTNTIVLAPMTTSLLSHAFTMVASPAVGIGSLIKLRRPGTLVPDLAIYWGTQFVSYGVNKIAKKFFRRQRPCYHFGRQNETEAVFLSPQDEFKSFYSGDTAAAFSCYAAALALVIARGWRAHGMKLSRVGGAVALIGSILRIVGFMHWCTDVLVGIVLGVLVGFGLPTLLFSAEPMLAAFVKAFVLPCAGPYFGGEGSIMMMAAVPVEEGDGGEELAQVVDRYEEEVEVVVEVV